MKIPVVSVLMPVHNGGSYLPVAVESILTQTYEDFEYIIVDDASTDQTVVYLQSLGDPRIHVLRSETRLRLAGALNVGLDHARGEWIARMDADDISLPDRLSRQLDFLAKHPEVGLCGGRVEHFGLFKSRFHRPPRNYEDIKSSALFYNPIAHPTVMMKRELLERYSLRYDPNLCPADDYDLWIRAMRHFPAMNMDHVLLRYRTHEGSLTSMEWSDMDTYSSHIASRELQFLGLDIDAETARFHRNIGRIGCMKIGDIGEVQRAEGWLHRLLVANDRVKYYPDEAFRRAVGDVWYRLCYCASALGFKTFKSYQKSMLRCLAPQGVKGSMTLLKNALWITISDLRRGPRAGIKGIRNTENKCSDKH